MRRVVLSSCLASCLVWVSTECGAQWPVGEWFRTGQEIHARLERADRSSWLPAKSEALKWLETSEEFLPSLPESLSSRAADHVLYLGWKWGECSLQKGDTAGAVLFLGWAASIGLRNGASQNQPSAVL